MNLTDQEKQEMRIKCAWFHLGIKYAYNGAWYMLGETGERMPFVVAPPKDYLNDLNAMADAESTFPHPSDFYRHILAEVCGGIDRIYRATATERAQAFVKVMEGKV